MKQYKIREEKFGYMLFDRLNGSSSFLKNEEYQNFIENNEADLIKSSIPQKDLPQDCLAAPSKVYFELTRKCNLKCLYCYNDSFRNYNKFLHIDKIKELLNELEKIGTFEIRLTGGEPTLYPYFDELLAFLQTKDFYVSLGSNGVWSENFAKKISESCIKTYIFSLDGRKEYNDNVRCNNSFDAVIKTVTALNKAGVTNIKFNCVLCKENINEIEYLFEIAEKLKIKCINFGTLRLSGRANTQGMLTEPDYLDMYKTVKKISELRARKTVLLQTYYDIIDDNKTTYPSSLLNKRSCAAGVEVAAISPDGDVCGCLASPANGTSGETAKKLFTAGNINNNSFQEIWLQSENWQVYRNLEKNRNNECLSCRFYTKRCFGNCIIDSYMQNGNVNSQSKLCFKKLLK